MRERLLRCAVLRQSGDQGTQGKPEPHRAPQVPRFDVDQAESLPGNSLKIEIPAKITRELVCTSPIVPCSVSRLIYGKTPKTQPNGPLPPQISRYKTAKDLEAT